MAKLLSGTRIYGTANADTSVYVGTSNNTTGTGGVLANNTVLFIGNNTSNAYLNTVGLNINAVTIANTTGVYTVTVNAASFTVGTSNLIANSAGLFVANTTGVVNAASHTVGSSVVANATGVYTTGVVNAASHTTGGGYGSATGGVTANSTAVGVGNSTFNVATIGSALTISNAAGNSQLTAVSYRLSNTTSNTFSVNTSVIGIGVATGISANASLGSNGQVLTSNGTAVFWSPVTDLPRVSSTTSITSPLAWNSDNFDMYVATAQASSLTISADAGIAVNGQKMIFRFKDNGTAQTLSFTTGTANGFRAIGVTLPTTTTTSKTTYVGCIYNATDSRWDVIAVATEV